MDITGYMTSLIEHVSFSFYQFLYNLPDLVYSLLAFALLAQIFIFLKQFEDQILINISYEESSTEGKARRAYKKGLINSIRITLAVLITLYFFKLLAG